MLDTIWRDIRHGARMLAKHPGFAAVAMLSIAVGVGANAAMFSVADGLVLRPLPVTAPSRIVTITATSSALGFRNTALSYPEYVDIRDQSRSFDGGGGLHDGPHQLRDPAGGHGAAEGRHGGERQHVRRDGRAAGGRPRLPRRRGSTWPAASPVVVLDHDEWARSFGSSPDVIGTTIRIGGADLTVIGVAPRDFTSIDHDVHPSFYVPLAMWTTVLAGTRPDDLVQRDDAARRLVVKARLKPGLTVEQARADVGRIAANLTRAYPDTNLDRGFVARTQLDATMSRPGGGDGPLVLMLLVLALAVLVVACANVGILLVSRAPARARDIAMRLAIGARTPAGHPSAGDRRRADGGWRRRDRVGARLCRDRRLPGPRVPHRLSAEADLRARYPGVRGRHRGGPGMRAARQPGAGVARVAHRPDPGVQGRRRRRGSAGCGAARCWSAHSLPSRSCF